MTLAIDSSAIVAILNAEAEFERFQSAINDEDRVIGLPTVLEIRLWINRRERPATIAWFERFLASDRTVKVVFDSELEAFAADAARRFGKGRHAACLNYGDCMTYAVAKGRNLPLLFKGDDFGLTDLVPHPASVYSGRKSGTER